MCPDDPAVHASVQTLALPRNHLSAFPACSEVVTVEGQVVTPLDLIGENSLFGIEATAVIRSDPVFTVCEEMQVTCASFTPMVRPGDRVRIQCSHTQTTAGAQYRWVSNTAPTYDQRSSSSLPVCDPFVTLRTCPRKTG